jgi:hypothetical protein
MSSEPEWTKEIKNSSICTWFYAFAIVNAIVTVIGFLGVVYLVMFTKKIEGAVFIPSVLTSVIGSIHFLFFFLLCSRLTKD